MRAYGMGKVSWAVISLVVLPLVVASCGKDVCVAGIGKCDVYRKTEKTPKSLQSGVVPSDSKTPVLGCQSWGQCWAESGKDLVLTATGGSGNYTFQVIKGAGEIIDQNKLRVITQTKTEVRVKVTDSSMSKTDTCPLCEAEVQIIPAQTK